MTGGPLPLYRERRRQGALKGDPMQELAAEKLQSLHNALLHYQPASGTAGWRQRLGLARRSQAEAPQGLYLYGSVGRGKSMLMDLFFEVAPAGHKRRVHFHAFMAEVHDRLHAWRAKTKGTKADPLPELAGDLAEEAWLLCFDEFVVTQIADAMILARLFEALFDRGVVIVATSNFEPDRLYEGGLQRERFLPFIDILKHRLDILDLGRGTDYRLDRLKSMQVYYTPLDKVAEAALDQAFGQLTEGAESGPLSLSVKGRELPVSLTARGVVRFTFAELCDAPLGPGDYLAIADAFHTLILSGIPVMNPEKRNEARRFMTLIDALYEHRVKLICSAEAEPDSLYPEGSGAFEFQRTVSRLNEMQAADYLGEDHR